MKRPRKTPEELMTPTEVIAALDVRPIAPNKVDEKPKMYTFKMLRGTNFAQPDFEVIDVDAEGKWLEPRQPHSGEYGMHSKVVKGTIVMVNKDRAKMFDTHNIGKRIDNYE
jgi:hypothetical protein